MEEKPYRAKQAVDALINNFACGTLLNVACGDCKHSDVFTQAGFDVYNIDIHSQRDDVICQDIHSYHPQEKFDYVWASHILEHMPNVAYFLQKLAYLCKPGGWLIITVPPEKPYIVGGHLTLWNMGLLFYNLVAAGFDCRDSKAKAYGYNISVFQQNVMHPYIRLKHDKGDIETLAKWFPFNVEQGFDGRIEEVNWFNV